MLEPLLVLDRELRLESLEEILSLLNALLHDLVGTHDHDQLEQLADARVRIHLQQLLEDVVDLPLVF